MYTLVRLIQINQDNFINNHDSSLCIVNLYTVSTNTPTIKFIFPIYSLALCWGFPTVMEPRNLHNYTIFYHKILGGQNILCVTLSKCWGDMSPQSTFKLGPYNG